MPHYPVQELLWNDGEGLDYEDLNDAQRFLRAQLWDLVVRGRARDGLQEWNEVFAVEQCLSFGGGAPVPTGVARTITNKSGVIGRKPFAVTASLGEEPQVLVYHLTADELSTQLAVGDAVNPRIDLIEVKLETVDNDAADQESRLYKDFASGALSAHTPVKRRKVQLTKNVVQGTPAASPAEPAGTSGYIKWATVRVPALHNAAIDSANVRDWRVPMGLDSHVTYCLGNGPGVLIASGWTASTNGYLSSAGAGNVVYVFPQARALMNGRLRQVAISGLLDGGTTVELVRFRHEPTAAALSAQLLEDVSASFNSGANVLHTHVATQPYWLNGHLAGVANFLVPSSSGGASDAGDVTTLALRITAGGAGKRLRFVRWDVAAC